MEYKSGLQNCLLGDSRDGLSILRPLPQSIWRGSTTAVKPESKGDVPVPKFCHFVISNITPCPSYRSKAVWKSVGQTPHTLNDISL